MNEREFSREPVGRFEWERIMRRVVVSTPSVKLVALTLATYADTKTGGRVRPGLERLMAVTGTSRNVVLRALAELKELGMLEQLTRGGNLGRASKGMASIYQLTVPTDLLEQVPLLAPDEKEQVPSAVPVEEEQVPITTGTGPNKAETGPAGGALSPQEHLFNQISPQEAPSISKAALEKQIAQDFEAWYSIYPKRRDRGAAEAAYTKARKNGATSEDLTNGAQHYAAERKGQDPQYTKAPATWLNKKCWLDEPEAPKKNLGPWDAAFHTVPRQYEWANR